MELTGFFDIHLAILREILKHFFSITMFKIQEEILVEFFMHAYPNKKEPSKSPR